MERVITIAAKTRLRARRKTDLYLKAVSIFGGAGERGREGEGERGSFFREEGRGKSEEGRQATVSPHLLSSLSHHHFSLFPVPRSRSSLVTGDCSPFPVPGLH
ncbi:hypothetical protein POG22_10030, partial [Geitlerinema sp. CS-897]|nr:hypothetical protein [Geitlerinema sp. CS-897]